MKSRSFVLQACAVGVVTATLLLTACGGLGSGYSYPYYPPYQPSHSSGSASDSSSSSSTPESSSSESSSEEPSSPASSEPPAPSEPELTPEQRLALYRSEVLQLLNTGRTVPFSAPASALSHKRPNGEDYTSLLPGSNLPGFVSKELYASGQSTPAEFVSHLKTRRSGVDWETILDTQYTQIGIGYAVDADGVPYWELLLLNG